jgi:hypothetical protein
VCVCVCVCVCVYICIPLDKLKCGGVASGVPTTVKPHTPRMHTSYATHAYLIRHDAYLASRVPTTVIKASYTSSLKPHTVVG